MSLVAQGLRASRARRAARRGHLQLPSRADPRRDVRGHAQGRARRPARARSRRGCGRRQRRASASTTRSSATTLEQAYRYRTELGPADERTRALAERGAASCSAAQDGARSGARTCRPRSGCSTAPSRFWPTTMRTRGALLTELGSAAIRAGEWERARALLDEAISSARRGRRPPVGAAARRSSSSGSARTRSREGAAEEDRRVAEALIPELEQIEDHLGLAKAWWLLSESHAIASRWGARAEALERGDPPCARSRRTKASSRVLVVLYAQALLLRPDAGPGSSSQRARSCSPSARGRRPSRPARDDARRASRDGGPLRRGARAVRRVASRSTRSSACASGEPSARSSEPRSRRSPAISLPRSASCAPATPCSRRWASAASLDAGGLASPTSCRCAGHDDGGGAIRSRSRGRPRPRRTSCRRCSGDARSRERARGAATQTRAEELARGRPSSWRDETDFLDLRAGTLVALGERARATRARARRRRRALEEARALYVLQRAIVAAHAGR